MRILYIASNPEELQNLMVERDVMRFTQLGQSVPGNSVVFKFLPALAINRFVTEIREFEPDVIHISAHGSGANFSMADDKDNRVSLTAETLTSLLKASHVPKLLILSACQSDGLSKQMAKTVDAVVGYDGDITIYDAREVQSTMYESLLSGATVREAFDVSENYLKILQPAGNVRARLHCRRGAGTCLLSLFRPTQLVACFAVGGSKARPVPVRTPDGYYSVATGVVGCPTDINQLVLATDDPDWIDEKKLKRAADPPSFLAGELLRVYREKPVRGILWGDYELVLGEHRLFALGSLASGRAFSLASTMTRALTLGLQLRLYEEQTEALCDSAFQAIERLEREDGSRLS